MYQWWNDNAVLEMMQGGENKINEGCNSRNTGGLWILAAQMMIYI